LLLIKFAKKGISFVFFIPIFAFILQPQLFEISFWVLPGLQHSFAMIFAILAVFYIRLDKKFNLLSMFFAACTTYCTGNGFLVFFSIMYILFIYKKPIWYALIAFILCFSLYLFKYKPSDSVKNGINLWSFVKFQSIFWASPFDVFNRLHMHLYFGLFIILALLVLFVYQSQKSFFDKTASDLNIIKLLSIIMFCSATALLISISREYDVVFSRFKYYAFFGLAAAYLVALSILQSKTRNIFGAIAGSLMVIIGVLSFYVYLVTVENNRNKYLADTYNWNNNYTMLVVDQPFLKLADHIYSKTNEVTFKIENELITKPQLDGLIKSAEQKPQTIKELDLKLVENTYPDKYFKHKHYLLVSENFANKKANSQKWFLVLSDNNRNYVVACQFAEAFKKDFISTSQYYRKGFHSYIPSFNFLPNRYHIYLLNSEGGNFDLYKTKYSIDFTGEIPKMN
jgi:hypothetical protein